MFSKIMRFYIISNSYIFNVFRIYLRPIRDLHDFLEFSSQVKKKKPEEIKPEVLKKWRENILTNEKERDRLTKIALKQQEELKQNFLMSKLQATKLTVIKILLCFYQFHF